MNSTRSRVPCFSGLPSNRADIVAPGTLRPGSTDLSSRRPASPTSVVSRLPVFKRLRRQRSGDACQFHRRGVLPTRLHGARFHWKPDTSVAPQLLLLALIPGNSLRFLPPGIRSTRLVEIGISGKPATLSSGFNGSRGARLVGKFCQRL